MTLQPPQHLAFITPLIHTPTPSTLEILPRAFLLISPTGSIISFVRTFAPHLPPSAAQHLLNPLAHEVILSHDLDPAAVTLYISPPRTTFLIPGFVDTHNHAPQWAQRGLGQGLHILDWLERITFANEARFADTAHARRVYADCVRGMLRQGVTTGCYYGSIHGPATKILADVCLEKGQRAFVGKCNMTRGAPDWYLDSNVEESLRVTEDCLAYIRQVDPAGRLVRGVLTPRFAICCEEDTLKGLGEIAAREGGQVLIQTHFNEAEQEMAETKRLFPQFENETDLYESFGLLDGRTVLAHCCFMSEYEMGRVKELGCGVAHCPVSNMTVGGGFMAAPVRDFLRSGIKVGLGTDSGGGSSSSMLDVMRYAMIASHAREVETRGADNGLSVAEVFYLATLGGARVLGIEGKAGSFEVGKQFDAVLVDYRADDGGTRGIMTMVEEEDSLETIFEKFVMTGDDRNIVRVYVDGRWVNTK